MPTAQDEEVKAVDNIDYDYTKGQNTLEAPDANTMRIMLSTDNHLGYEEMDAVRGMDSFAAFEEVLYLSKRYQCDMVLIAGDLFHENRPSRPTLYKTMEILRRYTMGHDPVRIQLLNDAKAAKNFRNLHSVVNYEDECYSVDLPIFAIHGNHDDPTRDGAKLLAALDLLAMSNLVNYFGCQDDVEKVKIAPVLLAKGTTQIALYGLGSMRDERLNRMWREGKVLFMRPQEDKGKGNTSDGYSSSDEDNNNIDDGKDAGDEEDGFFNLFTLHQNRDLGRGAKNCVQEAMIPEWMDLCVWGHEHECQIDFVESIVGTFRITQPGSSVATSLVQGEAVRKKVGILDIQGKNFRLHPVPLTQVRSFVTTELSLREHRSNLDPEDNRIETKVTRILEEEVNVMISNARSKTQEVLQEAQAAGSDAGDPHDGDHCPLKYKIENPERVLVRLRVEHSGFSTMNNQRFGAKFVGEVANSDNILLFHRKKAVKNANESKATKKARAAMSKPIEPEELEKTNVEDLVSSLLELPNQKLKFLAEAAMSEALEEYVDKNMSSAIPDTAKTELTKKQKKLLKNKDVEGMGKDSVLEAVAQENGEKEASSSKKKSKKRESNDSTMDDGDDDDEANLNDSREENVNAGNSMTLDDDDDDEEEEPRAKAKAKPKSSRARASTAKKSTTTAGRKTNRRRKQDDDDDLDDDDDDDDEVEVVEAPPKARSRRATKKKVNYSLDDSGDDDDESDAAMELDNDDDDDDVLEVDDDDSPPTKKSKSRAKTTTTARSKKTTTTSRGKKMAAPPARSLSGTAKSHKSSTSSSRRSGSSSQNNKSFDSDSGDDGGAGAGGGGSSSRMMEEDWGSATTRSQI